MEKRIWKVAAYARLSRKGTEEDAFINGQLESVRDFVSRHPEMIIVQEYVDNGYSGLNFDRPEFQAMLSDLHARRVDCVVCSDLRRLGRDCIDTGYYLKKAFPATGVRLIALNDNFDSCGEQSPADAFLIPVRNIINALLQGHLRENPQSDDQCFRLVWV